MIRSSQTIEEGFCLGFFVIFLFLPQSSSVFLVFVKRGFCYNAFCFRELGFCTLLTRTIDFYLFVYLLQERTEAVSFKALAVLEEFCLEKQPDSVAACD